MKAWAAAVRVENLERCGGISPSHLAGSEMDREDRGGRGWRGDSWPGGAGSLKT